jgi:predicted Zn-dependent protease
MAACKPTMDLPVMARRALVLAPALLAAILLASCGSRTEDAARYVGQATEHYEAGDLVRARLDLKNALQIAPKQAKARYLLALLEEREQNYPAVLGNLLIAVESDPGLLDARIKLGNYYAVGLKAAESRAQADAALAIDPNSPAAHVLSARAWYVAGDRIKAMDEARYALRLDPRRLDAATLVASLHAEAGNRAEALAAIDEVLAKIDGADRENLRRVRASLLVRFADLPAAEAELKAMAADYPAATAYDLALARLYAGQGRNAEAEARLRALVDRDPDNAAWRVQLAGLLASQARTGDAEQYLREAADRGGDSATLKFALAGLYEADGRNEAAAEVYTAIAAAGPTGDEGLAARNRLVALAIGTDEARARELVAQLLRDAPLNVDALLYRAAFSFKDQRLGEAIADLRSVLARQPESERARFMLARAYLKNGDAALAEDAYRTLLAANPTISEARNELAAIVAGRGNLDEAAALLREALEFDPADRASSRNLVATLLGQGDFKAAEAEAQRMLAAGESSGSADYQLGLALQLQNEIDGAVAAFRAAVARNPKADQPLSDLTRLLVQAGRGSEAEAFLKQHLKDHPDQQLAQVLLGTVYRDTNRPAAAQQAFRAAIAAGDLAGPAYIGLAGTFADGSAERLAVLKEAHASLPGDGQIGLALGSLLEAAREPDAAVAVYEQVMANGGGNDFVATNLAILLLDHRQDAASHQRALELASRFAAGEQHPYARAALGWAYYHNSRFGEAVQVLEQVNTTAPGNPQLLYYLGMAYLKAGNQAGARRELQRSVEAADAAGIVFSGLADARAALRSLS